MNKEFEKTYSSFLKNYTDAEECFMERKMELQATVRNYVNELIDCEQQKLVEQYNANKPLSKNRQNHLRDALKNDNDTKLLRTLETVDDVKRAIYRCSRHGEELIENDSVLRLTVDSDYCFPHKGSQKCLNAIMNRFSSSFSQDMIQATIQHITDKNLTDNRKECLDILRNHLH